MSCLGWPDWSPLWVQARAFIPLWRRQEPGAGQPEMPKSASRAAPGTGIRRGGQKRAQPQGTADPGTASSDLRHFAGVGATGFGGDFSKTCHLWLNDPKGALPGRFHGSCLQKDFFKPLTLSWAFPEGSC